MFEDYIDEKVGFRNGLTIIPRNNKVMIGCTDNGSTLFISKECYDIICQAIDENMTYRELIECVEDEESKEYLHSLLKKIGENRCWSYDNRKVRGEDMEISVDITNICNLRCKHCCVSAGESKEGNEVDDFSIMKLIQDVISLNPKILSISGGEPLMRKNFVEIANYIKENYHGKASLMTNATLITDELAKIISESFYSVDVSLDGYDEKSCSILRGKGTFEKCINGIKLLQKHGMKKISASMVVTSENAYSKPEFYKLCKKMELYPMVRGLSQTGRAIGSVEAPKEGSKKRSLPEIREVFCNKRVWEQPLKVMACQGAKCEFQISYTGNIYPCGGLMEDEFCMGNYYKLDNLRCFLENEEFKNTSGYKKFVSYKPDHIEKCKDCDFGIMCFTCVADIKEQIESKTIHDDCEEQYYYNSLYWEDWEDYESN